MRLLARDPNDYRWQDARLERPRKVVRDLSLAYLSETHALEEEILEELSGFDREALSHQAREWYDAFEWLLHDRIRLQPFQAHLVLALELREFIELPYVELPSLELESRAELEGYVAALDACASQLIDIRDRIELGADQETVPPIEVIEDSLYALDTLRYRSGLRSRQNPYLQPLLDADVLGVDADEIAVRVDEALTLISQAIEPRLGALEATLLELSPSSPSGRTALNLPGGLEYYQTLLIHHTGLTYSADEVHARGLELMRSLSEQIRGGFARLGYDPAMDLNALYAQLAANDGDAPRPDIYMADFLETIESELIVDAFIRLPRAPVAIETIDVDGPIAGYYAPPPFDGDGPGRFVTGTHPRPRYGLPSLLVHESLPGHHLQSALAREVQGPIFLRHLRTTGFTEGWATYAEHLALDLGWYENDPAAELGALQWLLMRAVRMVVDTGIHARGWSIDRARAYLESSGAYSAGTIDGAHQVFRYVSRPGHGAAYGVGMLEFLRLRSAMQSQHGVDFDYGRFHEALLAGGALPWHTIEARIERERTH